MSLASLKDKSITGHVYRNYVLKKIKKRYKGNKSIPGNCIIRLHYETPQQINSKLWDHFLKKEKFMLCPILSLHPTFSPVSFFALGSAIHQYMNPLP